MAKGKGRNSSNYYQRRSAAEEQQGQRTYNVQQSVRSKFGMLTDWELAEAQEPAPRDAEASDYQNMPAPTINPKRPRALKLAYSKTAEKLVVRFRDGTWWEYNQIPPDMWNDLKASDSTGRYLKHSGLDTHDDMGPFNPADMPPETRVLFNG